MFDFGDQLNKDQLNKDQLNVNQLKNVLKLCRSLVWAVFELLDNCMQEI